MANSHFPLVAWQAADAPAPFWQSGKRLDPPRTSCNLQILDFPYWNKQARIPCTMPALNTAEYLYTHDCGCFMSSRSSLIHMCPSLTLSGAKTGDGFTTLPRVVCWICAVSSKHRRMQWRPGRRASPSCTRNSTLIHANKALWMITQRQLCSVISWQYLGSDKCLILDPSKPPRKNVDSEMHMHALRACEQVGGTWCWCSDCTELLVPTYSNQRFCEA